MSTSTLTLTPPAEARPLAAFERTLVELRPRIADAQERCRQLYGAEIAIQDSLENLCACLWRAGESLLPIKEEIGHGRWMLFVASHFPALGTTDKSRCNRAAEAIAFFQANPKFPETGEFTVESIRKCVFHLAPEKESPRIAGDAALAPAVHHLTFVNHFVKWKRQLQIGAVTRPEPEVMRREFAPVVVELIDLLGSDWFREQLDAIAPAPASA